MASGSSRQRRRSRVYAAGGSSTRPTTAGSQYGRDGEGAETIGNSARGMLSGGLTGATTTRGGQQGGIGSSVADPDPAAVDGERLGDPPRQERDLTLGLQDGGTMAPPVGPLNAGETVDGASVVEEPGRDYPARDEWRRGDT